MNDNWTSDDVTYLADGVPVNARFYRPSEAEHRPAILLCPGRLRDISGLDFLSTALADNGYVVLATTYRGMDFFEDDDDAIAGLDYLTQQPAVDPTRLAIVGHSRGGMTALRTAAKDRRVRAVVALAPPTEFPSYVRAMEHLSPIRYRAMVDSMGGTPEEQPERYRHISAVNYASEIDCPVLLLCGTQDLHAPFDHSQWMYEALVEAGNERCELKALDGLGHFFERMYFGYHFDEVADLTVNWLGDTL